MASFSHLSTEIKKTKSPEISSDMLSRTLLNHVSAAVYTCDTHGVITYYNNAAVKLWGREPCIGKDLWCGSWKIFKLNGEPLPLNACPMARTLEEGIPVEDEEIIVQRPDGSQINVIPHPVPIFDADGVLTGAINTLIDVTEQRKGEKTEEMLAAIIESSHDAIVSKTLTGIIKSWNKEAENMFGYPAEFAIGKHISLIIPPERLSEENVIIDKIIKGEKVDHFETIRITRDGRQIAISLTVSPVKDKKGNIIGASKIARDITLQKLLEERMYRHAESLQIINSMGKALSENLDTQVILQKVTDATTELIKAEFGAFFYNSRDEKGEDLALYTLSGASKATFENLGMPRRTKLLNSTFTGKSIVRSDDITKDPHYGQNFPHKGMPEGHLPVVSYLAVPVFSKSGAVIGGLFYSHSKAGAFTAEHENLVASIASQAALALDNAKLFEEVEALNSKKDEFIGLASHELKTPVTSIYGYLQILERYVRDDHNTRSFIQKAQHQVNKLSGLISDLLDISKIQTGKLQFTFISFDLIQLVNEIKEMMQTSIDSHKVDLSCDLNQLVIYADRQRIEQVIINLVSNAIKYSPKADRVIIRVKAGNEKVVVAVQDFGVGIKPDDLNLIFEKFYRVQGLASHFSGLGIGLYISNEIVCRHKGRLYVESELDAGSTFTFEIPVSQ